MIRFARAKRSYVVVRAKAPRYPSLIRARDPKATEVPALPSEPPVSADRPVAHEVEAMPFESEEERFFSAPPEATAEADLQSHALLARGAAVPGSFSTHESASVDLAADEKPTLLALDPAFRARRARLRRIVAGVLCASTAMLLIGALARRHSERLRAEPHAAALPRVVTASLMASRPAVGVAVSTPQRTVAAEALPDAPASSAPSSDALAEEPSHLIRAARALLESGRVREGVAAARDAVQANPAEAEPYILLAAGLQDLGNWSEAKAVFAECQQKARRGPNESCRYFAHR